MSSQIVFPPTPRSCFDEYSFCSSFTDLPTPGPIMTQPGRRLQAQFSLMGHQMMDLPALLVSLKISLTAAIRYARPVHICVIAQSSFTRTELIWLP